MRSLTDPLDSPPICPSWRQMPATARCQTVAAAAAVIADSADRLVQQSASDERVDPVETIASELIPLCDALQFLGRRGAKLLRPRRLGALRRPPWLWGVRSRVERQPLGRVLIIGTWNFPLLLSGVQIAQALAAGNTVLVKPAPGTESVTGTLLECFHQAGVPPEALVALGSEPEAATEAIDRGVELIVLTGSAATGRKVLARAAETLTPAILELSGCDAAIMLPTAAIERLVRAIDFGLRLNSGATCIAPRRLLVPSDRVSEVTAALAQRLGQAEPMNVHRSARGAAADLIEQALAGGAEDVFGRFDSGVLRQTGQMAPLVLHGVPSDAPILSADLFAPVTSLIGFDEVSDAVAIVNQCRYRLAASVFGPAGEAEHVASQLDVGSVTINDLIVPTADPRLPFGGRGQSGFGVTRGAEGLLAMTAPKVISTRHTRFAPHLAPRTVGDFEVLSGFSQLTHGRGWSRRAAGVRRLITGVKRRRS